MMWDEVRAGLERRSARFVELLRGVRSGETRAVGVWSIADTAAHIVVVLGFDTYAAVATPPPPELADMLDRLSAAGPADVGRLNELALERLTERDLSVLADRIERGVAELLAATAHHDGTERISWLGDADLGVAGVLAHLLSEFLVHGFDIARATKRPWSVPSDEAALTFELFFADILRGIAAKAATPFANEPSFSCALEVDNAAPFVIVSDCGRLSVEKPGRAVDVRVKGDATAMTLVMYRRINPLGPLLRRRMTVSGRRPWRVRHLLRMAP